MEFSNGPKGYEHSMRVDFGPIFSFKRSSDETVKEMKSVIEEEMEKYPNGFIDKLIRYIYIVDTLEDNGYRIGGGYSFNKKFIFLSVENRFWGVFKYIDKKRGTFHHELASFIFNKPFNILTWHTLVPKKWQPVTKNSVREQSEWGLEEGFITSYGTTSLGNDFSEYAKIIFMEPKRIIEYAKHSSVVKKKVCYLRLMYLDQDVRIDDYFSRSGVADLCRGVDYDVKEFTIMSTFDSADE